MEEAGLHAELDAELVAQLSEQVHGLADVEAALQACPDDPDLLQLKADLEEGICHLRDSLAEVQQHLRQQQEQQEQQPAPQQQQQPAPQQQEHVRPKWLLPDVPCRFRFSDGQYHAGVVAAWQPQLQMPVLVRFAHPSRPFMLQEVELPLALVLPEHHSRSHSSSGGFKVGSRVLALLPGERLWHAAEVVAVLRDPAQQQQQGVGAAGHGSDGSDGSSGGSIRYTVQVVGQQRITTLPASALVAVEAAAPVGLDALDAAAATAAAGTGPPSGAGDEGTDDGASADADADGDDSSDMSISGESGEGSGSGGDGEEDSEGLLDDAYGRSGLGSGGDVLEHARLAAEAGMQQQTAMFAAFESSTRGIASKLMAKMGFRRGRGLGKQGTGIAAPLEISMQQSKKGLGAATKHHHGSGKKHRAGAGGAGSGGGGDAKLTGRRRKRAKAAAARAASKAGDRQRQAAMEAATGEQGLFAFINTSLGHGSEAAAKLQAAGVYGPDGQRQGGTTAGGAALAAAAAAAAAAGGGGGGGGRRQQQQQKQQQKQPPDRRGLVGSQDDVSAAKARVAHLAAMLERNKGNKGLAPQIQAKLAQAKREHEAAAAQHTQLHNSVAAKEATAKWMKKF